MVRCSALSKCANLDLEPGSFQDRPDPGDPRHGKQITDQTAPTSYIKYVCWACKISERISLNLVLKVFDAKKQLLYRFAMISRQSSGICAT